MAEVTIGEYLVSVRMTGVDDGVGLENVVNSFQVTPTEGLLELRSGNPGEPGPPGPDAWPWIWRGDVADMAALNAIRPTLGLGNRGWAYRVVSNNSVMYWDGETFYPFVNAFGAEGPRGEPNALTIGTVTTLDEGENAVATITGTAPNQILHLSIPKGGPGEVGPPGGPGPIMTAADVDDTVPLEDRSVLVFDEDTELWKPAPWPGWLGPWGLAGDSFSSGSNVSAATTTIATITIPAQKVAWRPMVEGGVHTQIHVQSVGEARVDAEVRIGSASGTIIGYGGGFPSANMFRCPITPHSDTALTPDSTTGVVPANTSVTLYVVLSRNLGTRNYSWTNQRANLHVWGIPVIAP